MASVTISPWKPSSLRSRPVRTFDETVAGMFSGSIAGTAAIQYATAWLGTQGVGQVSLILGLVLMVFVLIFQEGLLPTVGMVLGLARDRLKGQR